MTWTAPEGKRTEPPLVTGEREALEAWLDFQRETLLVKCSGLTAEQLKEHAVPPSRLTLLGLVRHMTDMERWWFRVHGTNQEMPFRYFTEDNLDADFEDLDEPDAPAVLAAFWEEVGLARAAVRDLDLDHVVPSTATTPSGCGTCAGSTST